MTIRWCARWAFMVLLLSNALCQPPPISAQDTARVTVGWQPPIVDTLNTDLSKRVWPAQFYHWQVIRGDTALRQILYSKALGANYGYVNAILWGNTADTMITFKLVRPIVDSIGPHYVAVHGYRAPMLAVRDSSAWIYGPYTFANTPALRWLKPLVVLPVLKVPGPILNYFIEIR